MNFKEASLKNSKISDKSFFSQVNSPSNLNQQELIIQLNQSVYESNDLTQNNL